MEAHHYLVDVPTAMFKWVDQFAGELDCMAGAPAELEALEVADAGSVDTISINGFKGNGSHLGQLAQLLFYPQSLFPSEYSSERHRCRAVQNNIP